MSRWAVAAALGLWMAAGAGIAQAVDTSVLVNEPVSGDLGPGGGHLEGCGGGSSFSCGPGDFAQVVADNEALLGVEINPIGKFDFGLTSGTISDAFSLDGGATSPFAGATGTAEIVFDPITNEELGILFTIDPVGTLPNPLSIVKIVVKQGTEDGNFVAYGLDGGVIADPSTGTLKAFIPASEYGEFEHPGGLDVSHWTAFSTQSTTTVPEPATVVFLGLGLVGMGIAARKRLR